MLAVAAPIVLEGWPVYALNMSTQDIEPSVALSAEIGEYLVTFAIRLKEALALTR